MNQTAEAATSVRGLLNLRHDMAAPQDIDAAIRGGMRLAGTNLWVLGFAIVIASVGLNVNSTAVIIGAMLISPLMGPIIAVGYGAAVLDSQLIRQALRTLAIFVVISLSASTLYFLVSPLSHAQSELLARTSPTIWDVAIAFFGGAAGMVGLTRREKTTLIPGVAIATALMPPLCTAGFGIASGQTRFFVGAFYLFMINGVFIAFATLLIARVLRLPRVARADAAAERRGRIAFGVVVMLTLLPSVWLAMQLVRQEVFATQANRYLDAVEATKPELLVLGRQVDAPGRRIQLTVVGGAVAAAERRALEDRLADFGLAGTTLELRQPTPAQREAAGARESAQEAQRKLLVQLDERQGRIAELERRLAKVADQREADRRLADEIGAQLPGLRAVHVTRIAGAEPGLERRLVTLDAPKPPPPAEIVRLKRWLAVRLAPADAEVVVGRGG